MGEAEALEKAWLSVGVGGRGEHPILVAATIDAGMTDLAFL